MVSRLEPLPVRAADTAHGYLLEGIVSVPDLPAPDGPAPGAVDHDQVVADVVKQANAGAALAYALYHAPAAWWTNREAPVPDPVVRAYAKACKAYGIGHHS